MSRSASLGAEEIHIMIQEQISTAEQWYNQRADVVTVSDIADLSQPMDTSDLRLEAESYAYAG